MEDDDGEMAGVCSEDKLVAAEEKPLKGMFLT